MGWDLRTNGPINHRLSEKDDWPSPVILYIILTVVTEVEAITNSKPFSYVSTDDLEESLTPSHFLTGRRLLNVPDRLCVDTESNEEVDNPSSN